MAPPWVMLNRIVNFIDGESAGGAGKAAAAPIAKSSGEARPEDQATAALKADPVVADPPEVTSLILRHLPKGPMPYGKTSGMVSSTDKGLVVLYTGMYQPGGGGPYSASGCCYLVYDASSSSLSAIPQLDPPITSSSPVLRAIGIKCLGATTAAILRLRGHGGAGDGACYVLAELVTNVYPGLPDADLYLWSSSSKAWRRTAARLPLPAELCGPSPLFHVDLAFAFGHSCVCWADLLAGVLICDLFAPQGPEFSFVPLPCSHTPENLRRRAALGPQEFRSMGCVCGGIKFVALIGYSEGVPKDQVVLKTWTLSPDLKEWKESSAVLVRDLWESESFREMELPRVRPMNPVLSMNEDEVVYISLSDYEYVDHVDQFMQIVGKDLVLNSHYVLRLDLMRNKVLYSKKSATNSLSLLRPIVLASDFSAYLQDGSKIHQRGEEASNVRTMVKRTKY